MQNMVFISHANPEDNDFTRWLALQLAKAGYAVWCDLTKLLGGEPFWEKIEDAIRNRTAKFLFVLSKTSNTKEGTLDEVAIAKTIGKKGHDFIIPLRVDDLPYSEINVTIHRLNVIDFTKSWAMGIKTLFEKLEEDNIPKDERFNPISVNQWWKDNLCGAEMLSSEPEICLSNRFTIQSLPQCTYIHLLEGRKITNDSEGFPAHLIGDYVVSFANADDLYLKGVRSYTLSTLELLSDRFHDLPIDLQTAKDSVVFLLNMAWENHINDLSIPIYKMANERICAYFTEEILHQQKLIPFKLPGIIEEGKRSLVGEYRGNYWHFGISANVQLEQQPFFIIRSHVLFSNDKKTILDSPSRLQQLRRSACKNWWNQHWRDRMIIAMQWIAHRRSNEEIIIPLSSTINLNVSTFPVQFMSPVTYSEKFVDENEVSDEEYPFDELNEDPMEGE